MGAEVTALRSKAVIPAKAGIHLLPSQHGGERTRWASAFAGVTEYWW